MGRRMPYLYLGCYDPSLTWHALDKAAPTKCCFSFESVPSAKWFEQVSNYPTACLHLFFPARDQYLSASDSREDANAAPKVVCHNISPPMLNCCGRRGVLPSVRGCAGRSEAEGPKHGDDAVGKS